MKYSIFPVVPTSLRVKAQVLTTAHSVSSVGHPHLPDLASPSPPTHCAPPPGCSSNLLPCPCLRAFALTGPSAGPLFSQTSMWSPSLPSSPSLYVIFSAKTSFLSTFSNYNHTHNPPISLPCFIFLHYAYHHPTLHYSCICLFYWFSSSSGMKKSPQGQESVYLFIAVSPSPRTVPGTR